MVPRNSLFRYFTAHAMTLFHRQSKFGSLQRDLSPIKDAIDYHLTRFPQSYLFVERLRKWVNWDKRVYLSFVRPGDVVLDVGANVGAHTVFLSHLVGRKGRVLAFEPLPANVDSLRETIRRRSRFANISVFPVAVGNPETGNQSAVIKVPGDDLTQASLMVQVAGSWKSEAQVTEVTCAITSLDAEMEAQRLPRCDFLKIDVEGGELDTLRGAARTIARHHPLIYCEVYENWANSFGYAPQDLFDFVRSLGYTEARAIIDGELHALSLHHPLRAGKFKTSSDVLFLTDRDVSRVEGFDRRYLGR